MNREQLIDKARDTAKTKYSDTPLCQDAQLGFVDGAMWAMFEEAHTPTDDEREVALIEKIKLAGHVMSEGMIYPNSDYPVKAIPYTRFLEILSGFRRTVQGKPGEHGGTIPLYGMLDVWMALYGTSHPEFDEFYAKHGYADTWARILAAVRERHTVQSGPEVPNSAAVGSVQGEPINAKREALIEEARLAAAPVQRAMGAGEEFDYAHLRRLIDSNQALVNALRGSSIPSGDTLASGTTADGVWWSLSRYDGTFWLSTDPAFPPDAELTELGGFQGEPTDAQVKAATTAYLTAREANGTSAAAMRMNIRAALRAAFNETRENHG